MGGESSDEVLQRGYDSLSDDDEDGRGLEYACDEDSIFQDGVSIEDLVAKTTPIDADFE